MKTGDAQQPVAGDEVLRTYQLVINLSAPCTIEIGRLGKFRFAAGRYIYTGSARRNLEARVKRHLLQHKTCRWHIDYLLAHRHARIVDVNYSTMPECQGEIPVPRFGATDCRAGCGSHFKYLGAL